MEFKSLLATAQAATKNKSWQEAASAWEALLETPEGRGTSEYFLKAARSMRMVDNSAKAELYIEKAMEMTPDHAETWIEAAQISAKATQWEQCAARWDQAAQVQNKLSTKRSTRTKTAIARAHAYQMLGELERSEAILDEEIARGTDTVPLRNAKAAVSAGKLRPAHVESQLADVEAASSIDIPTICQCFWDAEEKFGLAHFTIDGVHVWPLIRMQTYYRLTQLVGIYDAPHPVHAGKSQKPKPNPATQAALTGLAQEDAANAPSVSASITKLMRTFFRSKTLGSSSQHDAEVAILMATRKVRGEELYTQALRQEARERALLLDRGQGEEIKEGAIDFDALIAQFMRRKEKAPNIFVSVEDRLVLEGVRAFFERRLNLDLGDLVLAAQKALVVFRAARQGFVGFWKLNPVERFFLTNAYGITTRAAMVAAQDCGIRTIELQHGFISEYHLGYSWPSVKDVPYVPNELWGFGDYWPDVTPLPAGIAPRTIGAPYVTEMAQRVQGTRVPNRVVFTSQGVVGRKLVDWAIETAKRCPDKEIIYRLHPSELLESYEQHTQQLGDLPSNFSFSHRKPVIFELLAQTDIQVGAFSTTLLEGMLLGCRTIVVNLPGIEYMRPVIERGDALYVKDVETLVERIDEAPQAKDPSYYYAEPVSPLL